RRLGTITHGETLKQGKDVAVPAQSEPELGQRRRESELWAARGGRRAATDEAPHVRSVLAASQDRDAPNPIREIEQAFRAGEQEIGERRRQLWKPNARFVDLLALMEDHPEARVRARPRHERVLAHGHFPRWRLER